MASKICQRCGTLYFRKKEIRIKQWERSKYCSKVCCLTGRPVSDETRRKIGDANRGKVRTEGFKKGVGDFHRGRWIGELSKCWIADRTKIKRYWEERNNPEYKQWRRKVFVRDRYKCRLSHGGNCEGKIVAHHIKGWGKYPKLRYNIDNGITLCRFHHPRRREDEEDLAKGFQELVANLN